jgi:hypothetical protein
MLSLPFEKESNATAKSQMVFEKQAINEHRTGVMEFVKHKQHLCHHHR